MAKFVLSERAKSDLVDIWRYTLENWSEEQAIRYYNKLMDVCEHIASTPDTSGHGYEEVRPGLHVFNDNATQFRHPSQYFFIPCLPACRGALLSRGVAKAHQRRAGGVSDANDGRHPLKRSGCGMPLKAAAKQRGWKVFPNSKRKRRCRSIAFEAESEGS